MEDLLSPLPENFHEVYGRWKAGKLTKKEAAKVCGMPESTFADKIKKLREVRKIEKVKLNNTEKYSYGKDDKERKAYFDASFAAY